MGGVRASVGSRTGLAGDRRQGLGDALLTGDVCWRIFKGCSWGDL